VDHPLARRDEVDITALHGQPLLLREPGSTTRTAMEQACAPPGCSPGWAGDRQPRSHTRGRGARPGHRRGVRGRIHSDPRFTPIRIAGVPASTTTYLYCMQERSDSVLVRSFWDAV
jgi:hypothetical protein